MRKVRVLLVETERLPDHHAVALHEAVLAGADRLSAPVPPPPPSQDGRDMAADEGCGHGRDHLGLADRPQLHT